MPALTFFIAAILASPLQGAPSDVPKNHWAFPAVDKLFQEGLLKGYPSGQSPKLELDKKAKITIEEGEALTSRWVKLGMIYEYPNGHRRFNPPSRYELAVAVHAAWSILQEKKKQTWLNEAPQMAHAISAFDFELTQLGADTKKMIATLNDLRDGLNRPFHG